MTTTSTIPQSAAGKLFFVSGLSGGREVFLGKAIDEPEPGQLTLEGKVLSLRPHGCLVVRPFPTRIFASRSDDRLGVHHVAEARAHQEARTLLALTATHATRATFPALVRWVETAVQPAEEGSEAAVTGATRAEAEPFARACEGFVATAEEFRQLLFRTRQVESTRELDQVTELEGNLLIELGKITNRIAVRLNEILAGERELARHLEDFQGTELPLGRPRSTLAGWPFLAVRLEAAKGWARRNGKAGLVRELNALRRDAVIALNEALLEHENSLDTLVTEAFGQYGLEAELPGDLAAARVAHGLLSPAPR